MPPLKKGSNASKVVQKYISINCQIMQEVTRLRNTLADSENAREVSLDPRTRTLWVTDGPLIG